MFTTRFIAWSWKTLLFFLKVGENLKKKLFEKLNRNHWLQGHTPHFLFLNDCLHGLTGLTGYTP